MDINLLQAIIHGHVTKCIEMTVERMNPAVREQSHEVNLDPFFAGIGECLAESPVRAYLACAACFVYLNQVLVDNPSGSYIQVTDLRVAHLSFGETHVFARGEQLRRGEGLLQGFNVWCAGCADHVASGAVTNPPAVEDHQ